MRKLDGTILGSPFFAAILLGGGGYVTGYEVTKPGAASGKVEIVKLDTWGFLMKRPQDTRWVQCAVVSRFDEHSPYNGQGAGGWAAAPAPSDGNYIYGVTDGEIRKSTDMGESFVTITSLDPQTSAANDGNPVRMLSKRLAIDDQNPLAVLIGFSGTSGAYGTIDGFETDPVAITGIAAPANYSGVLMPLLVDVDPSSAIVDGVRRRWTIGSKGTGIYLSNDGPLGPYTLLNSAGMPTTMHSVRFDAWGDLWVVTESGTAGQQLIKYSGGAWTAEGNPRDVQFHYFDVDPAERGRKMLGSVAGQFLFTVPDGEGGWEWNPEEVRREYPPPTWEYDPEEGGPPWFTYPGEPMFCGDMKFDPHAPGHIIIPHGLGVARSTNPIPTNFSQIHWTDMTAGIEQLIGTEGVFTDEGAFMACFMDKKGVRLEDLQTYPAKSQFIRNQDIYFGHGYSIDKGGDGTLVHACHNENGIAIYSKSVDDGRNWTSIGGHPGSFAPTLTIACQDVDNIAIAPAGDRRAIASDDGGANWYPLNLGGLLPTSDGVEAGWSSSGIFPHRKRILCASKETPGKWWAWNYGPAAIPGLQGLWMTTGGPRSTFTRIFSGNPHTNGANLTGEWYGNVKLKEVPGHANVLIICPGFDVGTPPISISMNGGEDFAAITSTVDGESGKMFRQVMDFGFGKPQEGATYPIIRFFGECEGVSGLWETSDLFANTRYVSQYPGDSFDIVYNVVGDMTTYDRWAYSHGGSGWSFNVNRHRLRAT